jgi:hypothetical protein
VVAREQRHDRSGRVVALRQVQVGDVQDGQPVEVAAQVAQGQLEARQANLVECGKGACCTL